MELTEQVLRDRIDGVIKARDEAAKGKKTAFIVPLLNDELDKLNIQLNEMLKGNEKKNGSPQHEKSAKPSSASAGGSEAPSSLAQLTHSNIGNIGNRIDSGIDFINTGVEKIDIKLISGSKLFVTKKNKIYRHIRDWVNRITPPTEAQKAKKQKVLKRDFKDIEIFIRNNAPDFAEEILNSTYKISFGAVEPKKRGESIEDYQKRKDAKNNTFTLNYSDMMKKYFS